MKSDLPHSEPGLVSGARLIADVIDEHRVRAHRTASISEKVQLITTMIELRRTWTRPVDVLVEPIDRTPVDRRETPFPRRAADFDVLAAGDLPLPRSGKG